MLGHVIKNEDGVKRPVAGDGDAKSEAKSDATAPRASKTSVTFKSDSCDGDCFIDVYRDRHLIVVRRWWAREGRENAKCLRYSTSEATQLAEAMLKLAQMDVPYSPPTECPW